jgi:hypothetical protein
MLKKIKRIKDKTLTVQSFKAFLLFINFHLGIKKGSYRLVDYFHMVSISIE